MKIRLSKRLVAVGALVMAGAMLLGTTSAYAAGPTPIGQSPGWYTTTGVNVIRSAGSETTYYLMARLGDLYTQTSLYGCTLSADNRTCTQANGSATDVTDDWSRTEYDNGAGIGSGGGITQLCGASTGGAPAVDFARASRAAKTSEYGTTCPSSTNSVVNNGVTYNAPDDLVFADDSVPALVFPFNNASTIACTATCTATQIGPVANGWVPGNNFAGPYTNKAVTDIDNLPTVTGGDITSSLIYRIQCGPHTTGTDAHHLQITDWGQITDPTATTDSFTYVDANGVTQSYTPTKGQEGIGAPIGVPIYVPFVNSKSGTEGTWQTFSGCANVDLNGDQNNTVQENDAPQLNDIGLTGGAGTGTYLSTQEGVATTNSTLLANELTYFPTGAPAGDNIYAGNLVSSTIYYISYGVSIWEPHTLTSANVTHAPQGKRTTINFIAPSQTNENKTTCTLANSCNLIASARQLHNYVNPAAIRASALGFMNWICNTDSAGTVHGLDLTTGKNYSAELGNTIGTIFFFPREDCSTASLALTPTDPNS